jgi:hypothetical protein
VNEDTEMAEKRVSAEKIRQQRDRREKARKRPYAPKPKTKDGKDESTDIKIAKGQFKYYADSERRTLSNGKERTDGIALKKDSDVARTTHQLDSQKSEAINKLIEADHINRGPLPNKAETLATDYLSTVREIETSFYAHIDGSVLSRLVRLVHDLALKKSEVIGLRVQDVIGRTGSVGDRIKVGTSQVTLSDTVKEILREQIDHLKNAQGYKTQEDSPLFQMKDGSKYTEVARHLKKYTRLTLNKMQQAGIIDYFSILLSENIGVTECERRTAKFARLSEKEVRGIIKGKIQKAGRIKAAYEHDSYMDGIIERLQKEDEIEFEELLAIPDRISDFDIYNLDKTEKLRDLYFEAVEKNRELNNEGATEEQKQNRKRILKNSLIEAFRQRGITFDPATDKPRLEVSSEAAQVPFAWRDIIKDI